MPSSSSKFRRGAQALLIIFGLPIFVGCPASNEYKPPPPPPVTVAKPLRQTVTNYLEETGTTEAVEKVDIRARVRGYLEKVQFEQGTEVKAGSVLYQIQQAEYLAKVESAKAERMAQQARSDKAKIENDRQVRLQARDPGATSDVAVVAAKAEFDSAQAGVMAADAALKDAQLDLSYTVVTTPISGRVSKTMVKSGNLVGEDGATLLATVIKYDPIYANFNISERDLLEISDRAPRDRDERADVKTIQLSLRRATDKGFPFKGHIDYVDLAVDQSTGTFLVRGIFPNPDRSIIPGFFVRVRLPLGTDENAILVPELAIGADQAGRYVLIVNNENVVERRNITPGAKHEEYVVVKEGLNGDELVIVDGIQRARPTAKVQPTPTELPPLKGESQSVQKGSSSPIDDAPIDAPGAIEKESAAADAP